MKQLEKCSITLSNEVNRDYDNSVIKLEIPPEIFYNSENGFNVCTNKYGEQVNIHGMIEFLKPYGVESLSDFAKIAEGQKVDLINSFCLVAVLCENEDVGHLDKMRNIEEARYRGLCKNQLCN